jgi:hypothetical protein
MLGSMMMRFTIDNNTTVAIAQCELAINDDLSTIDIRISKVAFKWHPAILKAQIIYVNSYNLISGYLICRFFYLIVNPQH